MQAASPPRSTTPRILCIDDDPQLTAALERRLEDWGYDAAAANYGTQGISAATSALPDVIITDLRMPQGGGDYVIERLRENPVTREIPVIVLTGCRDPQLEMRLRGLGVEAFFTKPVSCEALRTAVGGALSRIGRVCDLQETPAVA